MQVSSAGREVAKSIIQEWEKLRLRAYDDATGRDVPEGGRYSANGVLTIGYGHTRMVKPGMEITEERAESLLASDMKNAERALAKVRVPLNENQAGALVSLVFNIGTGAFAKSTVLKMVNAERHAEVPAAIRMWNKVTVGGKKVVSRGLKKRRDHEAFVYARPVAPQPMSLMRSRTVAGSSLTGGATVGGGAIEAVQDVLGETQGHLAELAYYLDFAKYALIAVALVGLGLVVYARLSDRKRGHR